MDIGQELTTNNDQAASLRKKRPKINGAAEAPPAKRIKSSTDSTRPKVSRIPRASTATRTRTIKSGDSKWFTVVPSTEHPAPSDLVFVDARPRLWSMNRAELGSAFVEISDSKCVNGISWTLTDMPIVILDNESMLLEKSKDAGNELSMDLVLIREFHYANPNTLPNDEDSAVDYLSLSQTKDDSRPVHSLAATPSMFGEIPADPPMGEFLLPVPVTKHTTVTLSAPVSSHISKSKPQEALQEQWTTTEKSANKSLPKTSPRAPQKKLAITTAEAHLDPTPPSVTENPVSQPTQGRQPLKEQQKTADNPLLRPVQDAPKSEELKSSNNDSVLESATDHGSATLFDISSPNTGDAPKRKRGRPPKVQRKPSDKFALDPEKAVSQEKPVPGPPLTSPRIPDSSEYRVFSATKSKQGIKKQEASLKFSSKPLRDTLRNLLRSKKRENADESLPVPAKIPDPLDSPTAPTPKLKQGRRLEVSRKPAADPPDSAQGVLRPKGQKKPQPMVTPISDHAESISTAGSKPGARKSDLKSRKALGLSKNESLLEKSDSANLALRLNTGLGFNGARGRQRKDSEKLACEPPKLGPLPKSDGEGAYRSQKATKGPSERARSSGPLIKTSAYARESNSGRKERGTPVRVRQSQCTSQPPRKKEPEKPVKGALPSAIRTPAELWGGGKNPVYSKLRFTKKKDTAVDSPVPKVSDNIAQPSVPALSPASTFSPGQSVPAGGNVCDLSNKHLGRDSNKGILSQCTPDIPMTDLESVTREQNDKNPVFHHCPDNRKLPDLNKSLQNFAGNRDDTSGVVFQEPPAPVGEATHRVLSEPATQQIQLLSNHSTPTTSNCLPEQERQPTNVALHSLRFKKYKEAPMHVFVPKTSETSPGVLQSSPEERRVHLNGHSSRHYTPDRSMHDLENITRGQERRFEPVFGHHPDNRLPPNFNRLPLGFVDRHDATSGDQVAAGGVAKFGGRTRNEMDTGRDEFRTGKISAHVDGVETYRGWTARLEPPHWNSVPTGGFIERSTPWRDPYMDRFVPDRAGFGNEMRRGGNSRWNVPSIQDARGVPRRAECSAWPEVSRAHSYSPVPTSPWITPGFDKRSKSAPYSKPPPRGPRALLKLQESDSKAIFVTGASDNQVVALSNSRNLSPNLQSIRSEPTVAAQTQSSVTPATASTKGITMSLPPDELTLPASNTQHLRSVVPDGTPLTNQMNAVLSPTTPSASGITTGFSVDEPSLSTSSAPVAIGPMCVAAVPSHVPQVAATMDISMESQANKPVSPTLSTEPSPMSTTAFPPSLKRKGKEKVPPPECSDDEPSTIQDEVRQVKKAKLWHDPIVDVSRIFGDLSTPMACSSKTKLEDLPVLQSCRVSQTPSQTGAMVVEDQLPSLSVSSSPAKSTKRRGRPPKSVKVTSSSCGSAMAITPGPARGKLSKRQPSSVSDSVPHLTCSSEAAPQTGFMAAEDQLPLSSVSVAKKPTKLRERQAQTAKMVANSFAPVTSASALDELPSISGSIHKTPTKAQVESLSTSVTPIQWREDGVPLPIPVEIQALVDAYINGAPIGVFASSSHIQGFWGLKLTQGEEIGYAFMGFYRVCRVLESLDEAEVYEEEGGKDKKRRGNAVFTSEVSKTRVRWRFKLRWEPGGEGWQIRDPKRLASPWWNSKLNAKELAVIPRNDSGDSDDESTETYRLARRGNQNFLRRHCHFDQTFCSVLPLHLLAPINAEIPDAALPRGWHCPDCGKLNFRYYLRHRRCDSPYCRDKPPAQGYMVEVDRLRDPQDAAPLSLPLNVVPEYVRANSRIRVWNDRMKTLVYCFETTVVGVAGRIQHIFTCNLVDLQQVPSELFNSIQMDVPLRRPTGDGHMYPYFVHIVDEVRGKSEDASSWMTAPQCLHRVKEVMTSRGRRYGKKTAAELDINKLIIRAWVTSGSKRGSDLLQAKERCIVVMCLGCEVILSISPKSAIPPNDNQNRLPDLDKLIPMESFDPQEDQLAKPEPGDSVNLNLGEKEGQPHPVPASSTMREVMGKNQRSEKVEMTLSLVHGDVVLLEGADFEYSIKRTGTSILLIGLSTPSWRPRQALDSRRE